MAKAIVTIDVLNLEEAKQAIAEAYQRGRADAIDEMVRILKDCGHTDSANRDEQFLMRTVLTVILMRW